MPLSLTDYQSVQRKNGPGHVTVTDFLGQTVLNPRSPQVTTVTFTAGDATAGWTMAATNDATLASVTVTYDPAGASTAEAATALTNAWNANPLALEFARATLISASVVELRFTTDTTQFTTVSTPAGSGVAAAVNVDSTVLQIGFGHWVFGSPGNVWTAITPVGGVVETFLGCATSTFDREIPDVRTENTLIGDFYRSGDQFTVVRRGRILVPVVVDVAIGDPVHAVDAGANAGRTAISGGLDLTAGIGATFLKPALAGQAAEVGFVLS